MRGAHEGLRIGTVRRPPRGVPKSKYAALDYYDVWLPVLSPSPALVAFGQAVSSAAEWRRFVRKFRVEMRQPAPARILELLARLSHQSSISVGCYCLNEDRCHRAVLRMLLREQGAEFA